MIARNPANTDKSRRAQARRNRLLPLWIMIGGIAVVGIALVWNLKRGGKDINDQSNPEPGRTRRIKNAQPPSAKTKEPPEAATASRSNEDAERARRREMFAKMTVDEKIDYLHEQIKNTPIPNTPTNRLYATSLEQTMDWIFTCEVGNPPPLLPPMSLFDQMHLAEILIMDNPILEGDSDKAVESKETMKLAKRTFIQFLKDGGNPDDFLPYYHSQLVAAHDEYKMARQSIVEVIKTEPDIAVDYIKKVNSGLSSKGIKNVVIPKRMLDAFGIESDELEQ